MKTLTFLEGVVMLIKAILIGFGIAVILNFMANVIAIALERDKKHGPY